MAYVAVVSGASGMIATRLVKELLEKGYTVRGTVRDPNNQAKTEALRNLAAALPGRLELYEADLLTEGSFDEVVKGSHLVFHTASPFFSGAADPQKDLVDPALKGTKNMLSSVAKNLGTVKRVVLTASVAAVFKSKAGPDNGQYYTDSDWNTESSLESGPYSLSKTLAEKAAWELSKQHGFDLVTILPSLVVGPILGRRQDATSIKTLKGFFEGERELDGWLADVRDVARAHVLAAETPSAHGRYIVSNSHTVSNEQLYSILTDRFPQYKFPSKEPQEHKLLFDTSKAEKELGLQFTPVKASIIDAAVTLISIGAVQPKAA